MLQISHVDYKLHKPNLLPTLKKKKIKKFVFHGSMKSNFMCGSISVNHLTTFGLVATMGSNIGQKGQSSSKLDGVFW